MPIVELDLISVFYVLSQGEDTFACGCHLKRMKSHSLNHSLNECIITVS